MFKFTIRVVWSWHDDSEMLNWHVFKMQSVHIKKKKKKIYIYTHLRGLPWWLSGKESPCQCRRRGFDLWVGKIPWRRKRQLIPVFLPGKSHGHRSHGVTSDTTKRLTLSSILAWEVPMDRGARSQRVRYDLVIKWQYQLSVIKQLFRNSNWLLMTQCCKATYHIAVSWIYTERWPEFVISSRNQC